MSPKIRIPALDQLRPCLWSVWVWMWLCTLDVRVLMWSQFVMKEASGSWSWWSNCRTESSDSSSLRLEFPFSWLKCEHLAPIFVPQFNNLQKEGGGWEVIKGSSSLRRCHSLQNFPGLKDPRLTQQSLCLCNYSEHNLQLLLCLLQLLGWKKHTTQLIKREKRPFEHSAFSPPMFA